MLVGVCMKYGASMLAAYPMLIQDNILKIFKVYFRYKLLIVYEGGTMKTENN
jgi:hypothetical protein